MVVTSGGPGPRVLAFFERAFKIHPRSQPFERLTERSLRALRGLDAPSSSLRFRIALEQLRFDWDLLDEKAALNPDALRLQLRVLDLAAEHAQAERLVRPRFDEAPLGRLFAAIVAQGVQDAARAIVIDFGASDEDEVRVRFRRAGDEQEAMVIPAPLNEPLRGLVRFVEAARFSRVRALFRSSEKFPSDLEFVWETPDRVVLTPGSP